LEQAANSNVEHSSYAKPEGLGRVGGGDTIQVNDLAESISDNIWTTAYSYVEHSSLTKLEVRGVGGGGWTLFLKYLTERVS
jgi:hypothetical protein